MRSIFEKIEKQLQNLIESSVQIFPWTSLQKSVVISIIHEMRDLVINAIDSNEPLPNIFTISVHPEIYTDLNSNQQWVHEIQKTLSESAEEYDSYITGEISIEFYADPEILVLSEYRITSFSVVNEIEKTAVLNTNLNVRENKKFRSDAYLLLPNKEIFPLTIAITQIGRKNDNHLIIDDPTISRNHAQIRNINGNFVIFDLNSTSGTFVNGIRIKQLLLRAGDVISIANYPLVYGEESDSNDFDHGSTTQIPRIVDSK
ncbi:MAG: hypothetical protein CVU41_05770 [Chloroflexi bacterium HGW-Chloroflexi-3]|nr:MAG: hypothetical protein CVU41_05770 [Chloroflexi bacterium HGW-Chloroflexi-3]